MGEKRFRPTPIEVALWQVSSAQNVEVHPDIQRWFKGEDLSEDTDKPLTTSKENGNASTDEAFPEITEPTIIEATHISGETVFDETAGDIVSIPPVQLNPVVEASA